VACGSTSAGARRVEHVPRRVEFFLTDGAGLGGVGLHERGSPQTPASEIARPVRPPRETASGRRDVAAVACLDVEPAT
jgi:hypothetical protein